MDEFDQVLQSALTAVTAQTTLLQIALDYHQLIATCLTLSVTLRASADMMLEPEAREHKKIVLWNDGLASIR